MKKDIFVTLKKATKILSVIVIIAVFVILLVKTSDSKLIKDVKKFTSEGTKVLYITNKKSYDKLPIELLDKYSIDYIYIDSDELSRFEKTKLKKIINSEYLSNIVVIFKNGKISDALIDFESEESLIKFLQKEEIIPQIIEDISGIIDSVSQVLTSEYTIVYIPYKYSDSVQKQIEVLKDISKQYNIDLKIIKAYLLSNTQKEKINSKLEISSVEDQIVILVKEGNIVGSIRGKQKRHEFVKEFYKLNFINEEDYIDYILFEDLEKIIKLNGKNIIIFGSDNCKYCEEFKKIINEVLNNYDISVSYLNIKDFDDPLSKQVEEILNDLNFNEGITTPLTIIVESEKILDYVIGLCDKDYLIDRLVENGVIRLEVSS